MMYYFQTEEDTCFVNESEGKRNNILRINGDENG